MKAEQKLNTFKSDVGVFFLDTCIENLRKSFYCSFSYKKQQQRNTVQPISSESVQKQRSELFLQIRSLLSEGNNNKR